MGYKKILPSLKLSQLVNYFWILDVQEEELPFFHHILPFAWFELFFDLDTSSIEKAQYVGQLSNGYSLIHKKPYRSVGISFKPHAANCLFQMPAYELTNCAINWTELDTESNVHEKLIVAESETQIIRLLEKYVYEKIKDHHFDHVSAYISQQMIHHSHLGINNTLLSSIGISRRRIEQRFINSVGVSMSLFLRKSRFDKAVETLCSNGSSSLTQIGLDLGYYDQAHFSREFKEFAGITPKTYRKKLLNMSELERSLQ